MEASLLGSVKAEDVENESLSLLIPDIQATSLLVQKAVDRYRWKHVTNEGSHVVGESQSQVPGKKLQNTEERYTSTMMAIQFGETNYF